jgi:opacity protein-like surface antigen
VMVRAGMMALALAVTMLMATAKFFLKRNKGMKKLIISMLVSVSLSAHASIKNDAIGTYEQIGVGAASMSNVIDNEAPGSPNFNLSNNVNLHDIGFAAYDEIGYDLFNKSRIPIKLGIGYYDFGDIDKSAMTSEIVTYPDKSTHPVSLDRKYSLTSQALLVNMYWDVLPRSVITPYIGGGLGVAFNNGKEYWNDGGNPDSVPNSADIEASQFAWDVVLGVDYHVTNSIALGARLQYTSLGEAKYGENNSCDGVTDDKVWEEGKLSNVAAFVTLKYEVN